MAKFIQVSNFGQVGGAGGGEFCASRWFLSHYGIAVAIATDQQKGNRIMRYLRPRDEEAEAMWKEAMAAQGLARG